MSGGQTSIEVKNQIRLTAVLTLILPHSAGSGIDHNQDEDHYHLLLKIHEMRGLTIQSRYENYIGKHGRDYAPSSFAADSTVLEANSTFHIGISQRHGPLDALDPDSQADVTEQSTPSSAPDEFRAQRRRDTTTTPSGDPVGDLVRDDTTTQEGASLDGLTIAFRTTPLLVDRQPGVTAAIASEVATKHGQRASWDRRLTSLAPAKESILQRISGPSPNPIKSKLPLLADVDSDTGSEYAAASPTALLKLDRTHDGDDELGQSDLDTTPRRAKVGGLRPRDSAGLPPRSPRPHAHPAGYLSDSPSRPGRMVMTGRTGYLSDGTPHATRLTKSSVLTPTSNALGPSGSRLGDHLSPPPRISSPLTNPRATSTPKAARTRLMDGFSSMEDEPRTDRASIPVTYGGPIKERFHSPPEVHTRDQGHSARPTDVPNLPLSRNHAMSSTVAIQRDLEQQAYELDRAFAAVGGNANELLAEAQAYYEAGVRGRVMERWSARYQQEKAGPFRRLLATTCITDL